jgi:tRNA G18 (ribose-2'-O)-methylase SpoU
VLDPEAVDLAEFNPSGATALMFGCEATGLDESLVDRSDIRITIPMSDDVDSLNLAASAAITLWRVQTIRSA